MKRCSPLWRNRYDSKPRGVRGGSSGVLTQFGRQGFVMMKAIHYGWVIVGVGVLVKMTGLGFGRFAYPMLLPNMRESLGFTYGEMGLLSGAIMLG